MGEENTNLVLALDVGTTQAKAVVFGGEEFVIARASKELAIDKPSIGWVEQDPDELWEAAKEVVGMVLGNSDVFEGKVGAIGVTCQRETVIAWDKASGCALYPAIGWEDDRQMEESHKFDQSIEREVSQTTGLAVGSYYSALKMDWLIKNVAQASDLAEQGRLAMGTVDSWLLWRMGKEKRLVTDYTNAAMTLLFDIRNKKWNKKLLDSFGFDTSWLAEALPSGGNFVTTSREEIGIEVPVKGVCGDQQASLYAVGDEVGATKITYGTGTFIMQVVGQKFDKNEDFNTTLTAGGNYALEMKIERGGKEVEPLLGDEKKLTEYLTSLAEEVDGVLKKLPIKPEKIVIDGGVMRDGLLKTIQERVSGVEIQEQKIFDGTALGVGRLAKEYL